MPISASSPTPKYASVVAVTGGFIVSKRTSSENYNEAQSIATTLEDAVKMVQDYFSPSVMEGGNV